MSTMPLPSRSRTPLGLALGDMIGGLSDDPRASGMPPVKMPSKGMMLLGILGDALGGAGGRQPVFAQHLGQLRQQEREQAQWGLQRQAKREDYEWQKGVDQRYAQPDVSPMERDVAAWGRMTPEQRASYQQMRQMNAPDPDVFITLPNGQVYAGPRSGLAAAMQGGGQAPARPVGRLTPIQGGPTPPASGTFRP